jgi:hypothetical protein
MPRKANNVFIWKWPSVSQEQPTHPNGTGATASGKKLIDLRISAAAYLALIASIGFSKTLRRIKTPPRNR